MQSQDKIFAKLAHHPPQKLKDSSYFNYYNSMMNDSDYLNQKQSQQTDLSKNNNNFKTLCDRNFINTSQYHKYQKFGNNQHQRDMVSKEQKQQKTERIKKVEQFEKDNVNQQKQERLDRIKQKQQSTIDYKQISIYKKVIDCNKIDKPVTLSFSSIVVQIYDVSKDGDKVNRKMVKKSNATFDELQNILYCTTQQVISSIQNQVEQNIRQNHVDKDIDFSLDTQQHSSKQLDDTYFISYNKVRFRHLQKLYEIIITFPLIYIFLVQESYRQKIRISRKWIKILFENKFQDRFDHYANLFNVQKMKRELRNSQLRLQSKMSWDLQVFKSNTIGLKTINNKIQEDIDEIEIVNENVQGTERLEIEKTPQILSNQ